MSSSSYIKNVTVTEKLDVVMQLFLSGTAGASEYTQEESGNSLILRKHIPAWAVSPLLGLFYLLMKEIETLTMKENETLTISLAENMGGGTRVSISGKATPELVDCLNAVASGMNRRG